MKRGIILLAVCCGMLAGKAQSLEQAQKLLYYEKFKSGIAMLESMVGADAKNADAAYWLAQAYLTMPKPDAAKAKAVLNQAIGANAGNALLTAGLSQIDLLENRADEAMAKSNAAAAAAGKDAGVLLAVAKAHIDTKAGNYNFAIETLNKALGMKSVNKSTAYVLLGNAYRKLIDGGNADKNYRNALMADPKNALAYVRLGKIYQTQRNDDVMLDNYNKAVEVDPAFGPGYLELYNHFSYRDVNKAKDYLDKYITNSDADCNTDLFAADYLFRSGKYAEAIARSQELANGNCGREIGNRLKMLNAYCYERLGDSLSAKTNIEAFMQAEEPAKVLGSDYELAAKVTAKFPGSELKAIEYINKAYESDSAGRLGYLVQLVDLYKRTGNQAQLAATWDRVFAVKPRPSNVDLYNRAMAHMGNKNYVFADSLWQMYKEKYPDQVYGYNYRIKCAEAIDTAGTVGLAVPHYENMVTFAQRDTVKYKSQLVSALYKLVIYYVNTKKDKPKSIEYLTQYLLYDPTNEEAKKILQKLRG
jgi:hypothetical protein